MKTVEGKISYARMLTSAENLVCLQDDEPQSDGAPTIRNRRIEAGGNRRSSCQGGRWVVAIEQAMGRGKRDRGEEGQLWTHYVIQTIKGFKAIIDIDLSK